MTTVGYGKLQSCLAKFFLTQVENKNKNHLEPKKWATHCGCCYQQLNNGKSVATIYRPRPLTITFANDPSISWNGAAAYRSFFRSARAMMLLSFA